MAEFVWAVPLLGCFLRVLHNLVWYSQCNLYQLARSEGTSDVGIGWNSRSSDPPTLKRRPLDGPEACAWAC